MGLLNVTFPGITSVVSMSYTVAHGHRPGIAYLRIVPQASLPTLRGSLVFTDGLTTITLTDCLVDQTGYEFDENGFIQTVPIKDYRWKWQDCIVIGSYNVPRPDGTIEPATLRTVRQLASLLYVIMGVTVDVSGLPDGVTPQVDWEGEKAWAAAEKLLADHGCALAPDFATNATRVVRLGQGGTLPSNTHAQGGSIGASYDPVPDAIRIVCGETRIQGKVLLEAVAKDTDGSVVPANDVSYVPDGDTWDGISNPMDLIPDNGDANQRGLANKTVGRWFRVKELVGGESGLHMPDGNVIESINHILPLYKKILVQYEFEGQYYEVDPQIEGTFFLPNSDLDPPDNIDESSVYSGNYNFDRETGIFMFPEDQPVWKKAEDGTYELPTLYVTVAYRWKDSNLQDHRYYRERSLASNTTPTSGKVRNGLYKTVIGLYAGDSLLGYTENLTALNARLDALLDDWQSSFAVTTGGFQRYRGIQPIGLTGQIRAVTWTLSKRGAHTIGVQNSSCMVGVKGIRQRRRDAQAEPPERDDAKRQRRRRKGD